MRAGDSGKAAALFRSLEPKMRIELTTYALRVRYFTPEILGRVLKVKRRSSYWKLLNEPQFWLGEKRLSSESLIGFSINTNERFAVM